MKRKNYLSETLSKEEKKYLQVLIVNVRKKYLRDNYNYLNHFNVDFLECTNLEDISVLEIVLNKCEDEIKSALEFENIMSDEKLYRIVKALSLNEKMVLFSLYKENKSINQISAEMKMNRTTIWRIKNKALDKIMKKLIGGKKDVQ